MCTECLENLYLPRYISCPDIYLLRSRTSTSSGGQGHQWASPDLCPTTSSLIPHQPPLLEGRLSLTPPHQLSISVGTATQLLHSIPSVLPVMLHICPQLDTFPEISQNKPPPTRSQFIPTLPSRCSLQFNPHPTNLCWGLLLYNALSLLAFAPIYISNFSPWFHICIVSSNWDLTFAKPETKSFTSLCGFTPTFI